MTDYSEMTTTELWNIARKRGISNPGNMWRHELIEQFKEQDRQKELEPLYNEARKRGIQGYTAMSKAQLEKALRQPTVEDLGIRGEEMAASRGRPKKNAAKKPVRKTAKKPVKKAAPKKKPAKKAAKRPAKAPARRRTIKTPPAPKPRRTAKKTANPAIADLIDYQEAGRKLARQALKQKSISLADLNKWKNSAIQQNQLTGDRKALFLRGWLEVVGRYLS